MRSWQRDIPTEVPCETTDPAAEVSELKTLSTATPLATWSCRRLRTELTLSLLVLNDSGVGNKRERGEEVEDGEKRLGVHGGRTARDWKVRDGDPLGRRR